MEKKLIGHKIRTSMLGLVTITEYLDRGGQGIVFKTDKKDYLFKVCDPDDVVTNDQTQIARNNARMRYSTFSRLRFDREDMALSCLPLEYVEIDYDGNIPAYLMKFAKEFCMGSTMKSKLLGLSMRDRLCLSSALVKAFSHLHSRSVVHADIKPDNIYYSDNGCWHIQILDVDSGGYFGNHPGTITFSPGVTPAQIYKAPELAINKNSWSRIWEVPARGIQTDLWSLAVLLYQILVDFEGPFPIRSAVNDSEYKYFRSTDYIKGEQEWPRPWQEQKMRDIKLDNNIIALFKAVFSAETRVNFNNPNRPRTVSWIAHIARIVNPPPPCPRLVIENAGHLNNLKPNKDDVLEESFKIRNGGGGTLTVNKITTKEPWLKISQGSQKLNITQNDPHDIKFKIDTRGLSAGFKDKCVINIESNGGKGEVEVNISIESPRLVIQNKDQFIGEIEIVDYDNPTQKRLTISNGGGGILKGLITKNKDWLLIRPQVFTISNIRNRTSQEVNLEIKPQGLSIGEPHKCEIKITSNNGGDTISVKIFKKPPKLEILDIP